MSVLRRLPVLLLLPSNISGLDCEPGTFQRPFIHAAYYLWYGNPEHDDKWMHWDHKVLPHWDPKEDARHKKFNWAPPGEHHAPYRPERGLFSCRDPETLRANFQDMAAAGIDSAMVSWWGRKDWKGKRDDADSGANTDELLNATLDAAKEAGMYVSFHMEPYRGRTAKTFLEDLKYIHDTYGSHPAVWREGEGKLPVFWLYDVSAEHTKNDQGDWREAISSVRGTQYDGVFFCLWLGGQGDGDFVDNVGLDGAYTYFAAQGFTQGSRPALWPDIKGTLARSGKKFMPAVGPGYDDTLIRPWNRQNVRPRDNGQYYRNMWRAAGNLLPHAISITSYNEWGEGTQIEAAAPYTSPGGRRYADYVPNPPDYYMKLTKEWTDKILEAACEESRGSGKRREL
eukprot:TRINITY_DN50896_c1_g1_i1.p1 TRINITY_DN50896_c1_g1~~TRINITY_DN50896_c1_g1_i1.p1  ORF type:complete len:397 (+),score=62.63 TRINITY_DN50896_c1_g1_i1:23-1213(+)